ncbi:hypothetical protein Hamer_G025157 [Homarus americanus]|uniref:Uncharacterized protein n=1 Tax=Homarus americanus TaxID=6706 RepID=A0A8J5TUU6_HOMAM|nr:hypothetical protein Hamer_G025157 [Homarus americanus]
MVTTHFNFKSVRSEVTCADDIDELIGTAFCYQYMFDKRTSPWEMCEWRDGELEDFEIDLEVVDRLYYISHCDDGVSGRDFEFAGRMEYNGRHVYIKMSAGCDYTGFECQGGGEIYITFDPQIFLKSIITNEYQPHDIWGVMAEDGLQVEEPSSFDLLQSKAWNNVPMLKFLCHMAVYDHKDTLTHYPYNLPRPVAASVEEFIRTRETRDHYDEGE